MMTLFPIFSTEMIRAQLIPQQSAQENRLARQEEGAPVSLPTNVFERIDLTQRQLTWDSLPDTNGTIYRTTILLNVPPASSRQEESRRLFYDSCPESYRNDPTLSLPPTGRRCILDKRFLDLEFRMQQARRYLYREGEPLSEDGGEQYWISFFCKCEIEELIGKENREFLQRQLTTSKTFKVIRSIFKTLDQNKKTVFSICGTVISTSLAVGCFFLRRSQPG